MTSILLKRSGGPPLAFDGECIASADGFGQPEPTRWHELAVYRTARGRYVVGITLRTRWGGESDQYLAEHADNPGAIGRVLREYDPCPSGIGYPPGSQYADRQARVTGDLRRRYDATVTDLFEQLGPDYAERVV